MVILELFSEKGGGKAKAEGIPNRENRKTCMNPLVGSFHLRSITFSTTVPKQKTELVVKSLRLT